MTAAKPSPADIHGVTFDLDDTLLRDDLSISSYTVQVMRALSLRGIAVIPASGRALMSMKPFVDQLGCASLVSACNGAQVWDGRTFTLLKEEAFSVSLSHEIAAFGKAHGCYAQTYDNSRFYFNEHSVWAERYAASSMMEGLFVGDLEQYIQEPRSKILMMAEPEKIASMLKEAREHFSGRLSVTCSKPYFLEFNPLTATKGIALEAEARILGFLPENVMAFGDSLNDLPMLQTAGWSVAVSNGREEVRAQCCDVCGDNNHDGVACYLAGFFGLSAGDLSSASGGNESQ